MPASFTRTQKLTLMTACAVLIATALNAQMSPVQAACKVETEEEALNTSFMDQIINGKSAYNPLKELGVSQESKSSDKVSLQKKADGTTVQTIRGDFGTITIEEHPSNTGHSLIKKETTVLKESPIPGLVKTTIEDYSDDTQEVISTYQNGKVETITYKGGARIKVSVL